MPIENPYRGGLGGGSAARSSVGIQILTSSPPTIILISHLFNLSPGQPINHKICTKNTLFRMLLYVGGLSVALLLIIHTMGHKKAEHILSENDGKTYASKDHLLLRGVYRERKNKEAINVQETTLSDSQKSKSFVDIRKTNVSAREEMVQTAMATSVNTVAPTVKPSHKPTVQPTFRPSHSPTSFLDKNSNDMESNKSNINGNSVKYADNSQEIKMPLTHLTPIDSRPDEVSLKDHHEGEHEMPLTHATPHDREEITTTLSSARGESTSASLTPLKATKKSSTSNIVNSQAAPLGRIQSSSEGQNKYDLKVYDKSKSRKPAVVVTPTEKPLGTCKDGNNPFTSVPPDAFTPPQEANDQILKEWASAVHEATNRISRLQVGGKILREEAAKEAKKLDELRLKLFCPIVDNKRSNDSKNEVSK